MYQKIISKYLNQNVTINLHDRQSQTSPVKMVSSARKYLIFRIFDGIPFNYALQLYCVLSIIRTVYYCIC